MEDTTRIRNWKEWISLKELTDKIPRQFQLGLNASILNLTCLDAYPDHLVIGTNIGLVYLAHLPSFNIIKLKCENISSSIDKVASVSSVDDMIAAGCIKGSITIFQIPAISSAANLTASQGSVLFHDQPLPTSPKRFTLNIHKSCVTALTWSRNGMKLFSGDQDGYVGLTEVNYESSECTGIALFKVDSRIVQLSYAHQKLAVSYEERCLIYNCKNSSKVFVGKKPRNPPGLFGCAFAQSHDLQDDILYCARPGQKIWSANTEGEVLFSYIQKKSPENYLIKLLDIPVPTQCSSKFDFGLLQCYKDSILVSYSDQCLIILNVSTKKVLGYCEDFQKVNDVAITSDFIFVLDNYRKIVCISPYQPSFGVNFQHHLLTSSLQLPFQENLNLASLSEIKSKIKPIVPNKSLFYGISKLSETVASRLSDIAGTSIVCGNKFATQDHFASQHNNSSPNLDSDRLSNSSNFVPKPSFMMGIPNPAPFLVSQYSQSKERNMLEKTMKDGENEALEESTDLGPQKDKLKSLNRCSYKDVGSPILVKKKTKMKTGVAESGTKVEAKVMEFIDDSRTYEDFKEKIEQNESLLAEVLNINCLRMDHKDIQSNDDCHAATLSSSLPSKETGGEFSSLNRVSLNSENTSNHDSLQKDLSYGPPSGSSACMSSLEDHKYTRSLNSHLTQLNSPVCDNSSKKILIERIAMSDVNTMPPSERLTWGWQKHHLPAKPYGFLGHGKMILLSEKKDLYFSNEFSPKDDALPSWNKRKLCMEIKSLCSCDNELFFHATDGCVLKMNMNILSSASPLHGKFVLEDKEIASVAVDQTVVWTLLKNGKVVVRNSNAENIEKIEISCQELRFKYIVCGTGVIWGLTENGRIAYRIGVRPVLPVGIEWGIMLHPNPVERIHLTKSGLGWMIDSKGGLYVSLYVSQSYPQGVDGKWWQIGTSDYMFEGKGEAETKQEIRMTSNEDYLWVTEVEAPYAYTHSVRSFIGHRWECLGENQFSSICGGSIFQSSGVLYCSDSSANLFALNPESCIALPIDLPFREKVASISARPESLWILTKSGKIFIRSNLGSSKFLGSKWSRLDLAQIADIKIKHISLCPEVVWAVDTNGQVYMRQGPLTPPNPKEKGLDPAWLHVDCNELENGAVFEKVCVGNTSHLVWGIDTAHRIYVRQAIFPDFPTGTSWVLVPGILAQSLSISDDRVFVMTPIYECHSDSGESAGGLLFEREGITPLNYIGDSWKRIPTHSIVFKTLTVSVDNRIWALDKEGEIFRHVSLSLFDVGLEGKLPEGDEGALGNSDLEEWEIV